VQSSYSSDSQTGHSSSGSSIDLYAQRLQRLPGNNSRITSRCASVNKDIVRRGGYFYIKGYIYSLFLSLGKNETEDISMDYCKLPKRAIIKYGSGGSRAIIAIVDDRVYKYFPVFSPVSNSEDRVEKEISGIKYEIAICKELTKRFVKSNKTPHIIQFYGAHKCSKIPQSIFSMCVSYAEFLMNKKKADKKCEYLYKGHPVELHKPMFILEIEKATNSLENAIVAVSKRPVVDILSFLDRLFFQVFFTLETIKLSFPRYSHNDLFIRNVLTIDMGFQKDTYIRYRHGDMVFDVPADGLFVKLADFGNSQLSPSFSKANSMSLPCLLNPYRDYFSILYDVYDGENLGGKSLMSLIKSSTKKKRIDDYFKQFIDVAVFKKVMKNEKKKFLDRNWNKTYDKEFVRLVGMLPIKKYLKHFKTVFKADDSHHIAREYGN
jgi:hypothetical protein